jgi:hypothetical protein
VVHSSRVIEQSKTVVEGGGFDLRTPISIGTKMYRRLRAELNLVFGQENGGRPAPPATEVIASSLIPGTAIRVCSSRFLSNGYDERILGRNHVVSRSGSGHAFPLP